MLYIFSYIPFFLLIYVVVFTVINKCTFIVYLFTLVWYIFIYSCIYALFICFIYLYIFSCFLFTVIMLCIYFRSFLYIYIYIYTSIYFPVFLYSIFMIYSNILLSDFTLTLYLYLYVYFWYIYNFLWFTVYPFVVVVFGVTGGLFRSAVGFLHQLTAQISTVSWWTGRWCPDLLLCVWGRLHDSLEDSSWRHRPGSARSDSS